MPHEPQHVPLNPFETRILDTLQARGLPTPPIESGASKEDVGKAEDGKVKLSDQETRTEAGKRLPRFQRFPIPEEAQGGTVLAHEIGHILDGVGSAQDNRVRSQMLKRRAVMDSLEGMDASGALKDFAGRVMSNPEPSADLIGLALQNITTGTDALERSTTRDRRGIAGMDSLSAAFENFINAKSE